MKKYLLAILLICSVVFASIAQVPQKMGYQALIRDNNNQPVSSKKIGMKISILQNSINGIIVYQEIYNPNPETNANGLISLEIGTGVPLINTFQSIDWSLGQYFIKLETDITGGTNYTISSVQQLVSVPYALYALKSGSAASSLSAPLVKTEQAVKIDAYTATLNANVNANGLISKVYFQYGTTTNYELGTIEKLVSGSQEKTVSFDIENLKAKTMYHYRAVALNAVDYTYGEDLTLTTIASTPTANAIHPDSISSHASQLRGEVNPNGNSVSVSFEYGIDTNYGTTLNALTNVISGSSPILVKSPIIKVTEGTIYHFRIKVVSSYDTTFSDDFTFYGHP